MSRIKKPVKALLLGGLLMVSSCDIDFGNQPIEKPEPDYGISEDDYEPGEGWTLSWSDEFDGSELDSNIWDRQHLPSPYNNEWQKYIVNSQNLTSHSYVENSNLVLKATHDSTVHAPGNYTSARVISNPGGWTGSSDSAGKVFKYGKIAARIKLPSGKGIWPAFWLLGDNISETGGNTSWPFCGEIDIVETGSIHANDNFYGHATAGQAIHFSNADGNHQYLSGEKKLTYGQYSDDYHVFEIEWDEQKITWKIDGEFAYSADITASHFSEFHKDFYIIFNIAVGGGYTDEPDDSTSFPQYMYVDWIRHYTQN